MMEIDDWFQEVANREECKEVGDTLATRSTIFNDPQVFLIIDFPKDFFINIFDMLDIALLRFITMFCGADIIMWD